MYPEFRPWRAKLNGVLVARHSFTGPLWYRRGSRHNPVREAYRIDTNAEVSDTTPFTFHNNTFNSHYSTYNFICLHIYFAVSYFLVVVNIYILQRSTFRVCKTQSPPRFPVVDMTLWHSLFNLNRIPSSSEDDVQIFQRATRGFGC